MKTRIEKVLEETGNSENRAAKMDVDDILKWVFRLLSQMMPDWQPVLFWNRLLAAFHDIGVHFAWWCDNTASTDTSFLNLFLLLSFYLCRNFWIYTCIYSSPIQGCIVRVVGIRHYPTGTHQNLFARIARCTHGENIMTHGIQLSHILAKWSSWLLSWITPQPALYLKVKESLSKAHQLSSLATQAKREYYCCFIPYNVLQGLQLPFSKVSNRIRKLRWSPVSRIRSHSTYFRWITAESRNNKNNAFCRTRLQCEQQRFPVCHSFSCDCVCYGVGRCTRT